MKTKGTRDEDDEMTTDEGDEMTNDEGTNGRR
jgi:hypothetical protein